MKITNVLAACATCAACSFGLVACGDGGGNYRQYRIDGTIAGLRSDGLVLKSGADSLSVTKGATNFEVNSGAFSGTPYAIEVATQPGGQTCNVMPGTGSGTVGTSDVDTIRVNCRNYVAIVLDYQNQQVNTYALGDDGSVPDTPVSSVAAGSGAFDMAFSPDGAHGYAAGLQVQGFSIDASGDLALLPGAPVAAGAAIAVTMTPDGRFIYVADNPSSAIRQYAVRTDATLAPLIPATVASVTAADEIAISPNGQFAYVTGETGTIAQFAVGADGRLTPLSPARIETGFSTVRMIAIDPTGRFAYINNADYNTISQYGIASDGTLHPLAVPSVTAGLPGVLAISPDGRNLYATGVDAIGNTCNIFMFRIGEDGNLSALTTASIVIPNDELPMAFSPDGATLYATSPGRISQFARAADGMLTLRSTTNENSRSYYMNHFQVR